LARNPDTNSQVFAKIEGFVSNSIVLPDVEMTLTVDFLDIDVMHLPRHADTYIWVFFEDFPYNASYINMEIG